jgi:hypothetical protein
MPVSTEQILHPERYPNDKPQKVNLPDISSILADGWRQLTTNNVGEWYTYLYLAKGIDSNARLDDTQAKTAAEGWRSGKRGINELVRRV